MRLNILVDENIKTYDVSFSEEATKEIEQELFLYDKKIEASCLYMEGDENMRHNILANFGADCEIEVLEKIVNKANKREKGIVKEKVTLAFHCDLWHLIFGRYAGCNNLLKMLHLYLYKEPNALDEEIGTEGKNRLVKFLLSHLSVKFINSQSLTAIENALDVLSKLTDFDEAMKINRKKLIQNIQDQYIEAKINQEKIEEIENILNEKGTKEKIQILK